MQISTEKATELRQRANSKSWSEEEEVQVNLSRGEELDKEEKKVSLLANDDE